MAHCNQQEVAEAAMNDFVTVTVNYLPADGLDDAVQLIIRGRIAATHRKHKVDRIKQAREGLGEVGCLIRLQRVLQSLLWALCTQIDGYENIHN